MYTLEFYPPLRRLVAGRDGTIWLARSPSTATSTEWLVLDGDGEPIGTVEIPRAMRLMIAERSMIWGTERDEFDVDYIVRYGVSFPETTWRGAPQDGSDRSRGSYITGRSKDPVRAARTPRRPAEEERSER